MLGVRPLQRRVPIMRTLRLKMILVFAISAIGLTTTIAIAQANSVSEPKVKSTELPSYPPLARAACVQGSVAVLVEIGEEGQVTATDILYGHTLLRSAADSAAKKWRFEARSDTARREVLRFTFRILPFETPAKRLKAILTRPTDVEIRSYPPEPSCDDCSPRRLKELRKGGCPEIC